MSIKSIIVVLFFFTCNVSLALTIQEGDYYPSYLQVFGDTLIMTGGTIVENLYLKEDQYSGKNSYGEIYGGYIGQFLCIDEASEASMYGGHIVSGISSSEDGKFNWYGGVIDGEIRSGWMNSPSCFSYHKIYGYDFEIDGESVGDCILTYQGFQRHLTGFLQDGTAIDNDLVIYGGSRIELVVVPEPATLLISLLGSIILRKRNFKIN